MQVNKVMNNVNQQLSFQSNKKVKADKTKTKTGKQKTVRVLSTLAALGAVGAATILLIKKAEKGKCAEVKNALNEIKENAEKFADTDFLSEVIV